ncbi:MULTISPECIES: hypothetical protein [Methylosinus]|nr:MULTISPECIES: hypothetical protein [Methylosinus]
MRRTDRLCALLATALASMLVLEGLVLAASPAPVSASAHDLRAAMTCFVDGHDHAPAQHRGDAAPCCAFCGAGARDMSGDDSAPPPLAPFLATAETAASRISIARGDEARRSPRRANAGSPRAPPRV